MSSPAKIRPHGTRAKFVVEHCPCGPCRDANRKYENNRVRQRAYGRSAYVDAEPVREHVRALQAAGLGWKRVAKLAGLDNSVLWKLLHGDLTRFDGPSKRVRPATAEKILAVRATLDTLGDMALVDAIGARRRLQALVAMGWSQSKLCERLGVRRSNFTGTMHRDKLHVATVRAVRKLYNDLWDVSPPEQTHRDKIAASRARNYARAHGFAPPQAWDDDTIDDPAAVPDGAIAPRKPGPKSALPSADEIRFLLAGGDTVSTIATRYRVKEASVQRALSRADEQSTPPARSAA